MEYFSNLALVEYCTKWIRIKWGPGVLTNEFSSKIFHLRIVCNWENIYLPTFVSSKNDFGKTYENKLNSIFEPERAESRNFKVS